MPPQTGYKKAVLTQTPPSMGTQQVHFDRKQFDDFITAKGYDCYIERAIKCPCQAVATGQPLPSCLNCAGTGWVYINKQETRLAAVSMSNLNKYQQWSEVNLGTISISSSPGDKLGFMDRITLLELQMWHSELVTLRKSNDGTKVFAFTRYFPISVFEVYQFNGDSNPLIYVDPSLYTVTNNQILFDMSTFVGYVGQSFSLRYTFNPMYLVIDINRDLIKQSVGRICNTLTDDRENLPLHSVARLAHYVLDAPNLQGNSVFDNTNYNVNPNYDI